MYLKDNNFRFILQFLHFKIIRKTFDLGSNPTTRIDKFSVANNIFLWGFKLDFPIRKTVGPLRYVILIKLSAARMWLMLKRYRGLYNFVVGLKRVPGR